MRFIWCFRVHHNLASNINSRSASCAIVSRRTSTFFRHNITGKSLFSMIVNQALPPDPLNVFLRLENTCNVSSLAFASRRFNVATVTISRKKKKKNRRNRGLISVANWTKVAPRFNVPFFLYLSRSTVGRDTYLITVRRKKHGITYNYSRKCTLSGEVMPRVWNNNTAVNRKLSKNVGCVNYLFFFIVRMMEDKRRR